MTTATAFVAPDYAAAAAELLGGNGVLGEDVRVRADLDRLAANGLTRRSLSAFVDAFGNEVLWAFLLPLSGKQVGSEGGDANTDDHTTSTALVEGALLLAHAIDVLGDRHSARAWLSAEIPALAHQRPIDLLRRGDIQQVNDALGRLQHGVYA